MTDLPATLDAPRRSDGHVDAPATGEQSGLRRLGLTIALVLTVGVIGAGTWALGSEDPPRDDLAPATAGFAGPGAAARPPLAVAPPPDAEADRADRSGRSERTARAE